MSSLPYFTVKAESTSFNRPELSSSIFPLKEWPPTLTVTLGFFFTLRYHWVFLPCTGISRIDLSPLERTNQTGRGMIFPLTLPVTDSSISVSFLSARRIFSIEVIRVVEGRCTQSY